MGLFEMNLKLDLLKIKCEVLKEKVNVINVGY